MCCARVNKSQMIDSNLRAVKARSAKNRSPPAQGEVSASRSPVETIDSRRGRRARLAVGINRLAHVRAMRGMRARRVGGVRSSRGRASELTHVNDARGMVGRDGSVDGGARRRRRVGPGGARTMRTGRRSERSAAAPGHGYRNRGQRELVPRNVHRSPLLVGCSVAARAGDGLGVSASIPPGL